ncbi:serine hydrolase domain-containing protein [Paenibacillus sp. SYP-B4298]|uniref:serine hydrolase domain-containing protein n=1 Tax=Paenibacillus sp. SYP-B4298 TaxID=2996034 RepID=UPI0022DE6249|nr:serine hydrolase domain-containing protein [Paenibacillus sp. SYP-B4298]
MVLIQCIVLPLLLLLGAAAGLLAYMNRPLSRGSVTARIQEHLTKVAHGNNELSSVLLTIYSPSTGYLEQFAAGTKNFATSEPARVNSPYHSASIGKMLCATIYGMLVDEGKLGFDDPVRTWLGDEVLDGLFVVDGIDYCGQVTVRHLLTHTSGVNDYFAGPVVIGSTMLERIKAAPDEIFTPMQLVAFTRERQQPVGRPGEQFYYSDTGYVLLGLILEAIEERSYADIMQERLFKPLGMQDSYVKDPYGVQADALGVYVDGIDFNGKKALSIDWAGGGIITTMDDLLAFMKSFTQGALVSSDVYRQMTDFSQRYDQDIYYGMGMMYFDFSKLSFLLRGMTDVYGGVGSTGTYVLYDPAKETYYIANFGSLHYARQAIQQLIRIRMIYNRMIVK